jgi:hypothetical protein
MGYDGVTVIGWDKATGAPPQFPVPLLAVEHRVEDVH